MRATMSRHPESGWRRRFGSCLALLVVVSLWGCEEEDPGAADQVTEREEPAEPEPEAPPPAASEGESSEPDSREAGAEESSQQEAPPEVTGPMGWSLYMEDASWYERHVGPRDIDESDLSVHEGRLDIEEPGTVIDGMRIEGPLHIQADNVTVRNTVIEGVLNLRESAGALIEDVIVRSDSYHPVDAADAQNWTLQYAEVDGLESPDNNGGLYGGDGQVRFSEFHSHTDSAKVRSNSMWEYNWLHSNSTWGTDVHVDGLQSMGASNVTVRRNYIDMPISNEANSAIIAQSDFGAIRNWTVRENYLNGGNYTLFFRDKEHGEPEDVVIKDNMIGRDYRYGLISSDGEGIELGQNYWSDTGESID
jgi:hypothetical protein